MANTWQAVIVRTDLDMSVGLIAAQVAHINDGWMRDAINSDDGYEYTNEQLEWAQEPYLNILAVSNIEELNDIIDKAKAANLAVHKWTDVIPSKNLKTNLEGVTVGCSIGPADFDKLRLVTGTLPRL